MKFKSAVIGALALLTPGLAHAAALTWTLTDAVFADGGTATGTFVWDADTLTLGDYQFFTTGGDTDVFPAYEYNSANAGEFGAFESQNVPLFTFSRPDDTIRENTYRSLYLSVVALLTNAGGDVALDIIDSNYPAGECYNCSPYRPFVSGSVVAQGVDPGGPSVAPEPGTWALMLMGFGALGVALRRRPTGADATA